MGFTRNDLRALTARWPNVDDEVLLDVAISNVVANLIGYPRGLPNEWRRYIDAEPSDLADLVGRWRAGAYSTPKELSVHWDETQPLNELIDIYYRDIRRLGERARDAGQGGCCAIALGVVQGSSRDVVRAIRP